MRVLIDIRTLAAGKSSGIPLYTKELVNQLLTNSSESFELFYSGVRNVLPPPSWMNQSHVKIIRRKIPNKLIDILHYFGATPSFESYSSADIVLSPHINSLSVGKISRIITVHDLSFVHHAHFFSKSQRLWHRLQNWKLQLQNTRHLIAVSQSTKRDMSEMLSIPPERISVIYPGVSSEFKPLDVHDRKLLDFQKKYDMKRPYILYLGSLEKRKNIGLLIRAFELMRRNAQFRDIDLILAGAPGFGSSALMRLITQSSSRHSIRILSRIADEERVLLYNGAIAFAYPSFFEGFGFPPLEAQACGIPVIVSDRTSLPEITGKSAMIVNPWKPLELADALSALVVNGSLRMQLRSLGLMNSARFSWERCGEEVMKLLRRFSQ